MAKHSLPQSDDCTILLALPQAIYNTITTLDAYRAKQLANISHILTMTQADNDLIANLFTEIVNVTDWLLSDKHAVITDKQRQALINLSSNQIAVKQLVDSAMLAPFRDCVL